MYINYLIIQDEFKAMVVASRIDKKKREPDPPAIPVRLKF